MSHIEKFWRDATVSDLVRVMESETVEARFADDGSNWVLSKLRGWRSSSRVLDNWIDDDGARWDRCQVYSPPQWFLDKPEPGEGYRLLGKFPDEPVQGGDFAFCIPRGWVELVDGCEPTQGEGIWYRRRIEPKPEPKFAVGQRVRVARPKQKTAQNGGSDIDEFFGYADIIASVRENGGKFTSYVLEHIDERDFPEDYLEPVVEPEPKHYTLKVGDTADVPSGHRIKITEHGVEVT